MPPTAIAMPASVRGAMRSRRKSQLISATVAGMPAMITPATTAELCFIPNSRQIENRKLPKKDSRKSSHRVRRESGASAGPRRSHGSMNTAAMPKRRKASRKTGKTSTSSLDSPT